MPGVTNATSNNVVTSPPDTQVNGVSGHLRPPTTTTQLSEDGSDDIYIVEMALLRLVPYAGLMHGVCERLPEERPHKCRLLRRLHRSIKMVSKTQYISTEMESILPQLLHFIRMVFKMPRMSTETELILRWLRDPTSRRKMTNLFFHKPHTLHLRSPSDVGTRMKRAWTRTVSIMPQMSILTTLSKATTILLQLQQTPHSPSTCFSCQW